MTNFASSPQPAMEEPALESPHTASDAGAGQEGPDDSQRGEANHLEAEEVAWIEQYESAVAKAKDQAALDRIHAQAAEAAARVRREFPDLYVARLDGVRPADAPERGEL